MLGTNDYPSESIAVQIKAELISLRQQWAASNEKLERLQGPFQALMANRFAMHRKMHSLCAIVSPVKKVPREVMSIVFEYCLSPFAAETFPDELRSGFLRNSVTPPLTLSHVCRSWRNLALSLPKLWSNIEIYIIQDLYMGSSAFVNAAKKRLDSVAHWVEHSKSCQLACKVKIKGSQDALLACQNTIRQLLELLAAQSNRWWSMTLSFPSKNTAMSSIL